MGVSRRSTLFSLRILYTLASTNYFQFYLSKIWLLCGGFSIAQQVLFPSLIITLYYNYQLGADTYRIVNMNPASSVDHDSGFPWFEQNNFNGWLVQFKAHLRKTKSHFVLETPRPRDKDAQGNPIQLTAAERRVIQEYDEADNIAFSELMKSCRLNPRTKNLAETGGFNTAFDLLTRLRQRFHTVDEVAKAAHLLQYHSLKQLDNETGADFVDREQKEYLALQQMGINVDDALRLTKFIQQGTTNSRHKSLAQTIFSTPNMTLKRATGLFETYAPADPVPVVNALFCRYCKAKDHNIQSCTKKKKNFQKKRGQNSVSSAKPTTSNKKQRFPCVICDSVDHLTYQCPRKSEARKCLASSSSSVRWGDDEEHESK